MLNVVLDFTLEEEDAITKSATKRKQEKDLSRKIRDEHFILRSKTIHEYFLRLSSGNKKEFILNLIKNIDNVNSVVQILYILANGFAKTAAYTYVDPSINLRFDALLRDHNRMLQPKILQETMAADAIWFSTLHTNLQVSFLTTLIRSSGGNVKRKIYLPLFRIYSAKLREAREAKCTRLDTITNYENTSSKSDEYEEDYDPNHPASLEVEQLRKKWDEMMHKYKSDIESVAKQYRDNYGKKPETSKESTKKTLNASPTRSSKNTARRDEFDSHFITLQLLPVWLMKKIVGYLDDKSLQTLKKVDSYCSYIVHDLLRERAARQTLNKYIRSKEADLGTKIIKNALKTLEERKPKLVPHGHRKFYEMGAIDEKLVPKVKGKLVEESLVSNALKELRGDISQLNGEIVPFPRLISDDLELYGYRPCILKDIDVRFNADVNIEQQKSMLTYSLTSIVSTLKISVDEETLSEW